MRTVQTERWTAFCGEAADIFQKHWESLGLDREHIKPDLDYERYAKLDEMEMMHCVTARADGKLVGYIICFLIIHMHYKSSGMMALADMYYILPEYRVGGLGAKMFMEMERGLRANNITRAHMSCKTHEDHSQLFIKMGWKLTDYTFSKFLKAGN